MKPIKIQNLSLPDGMKTVQIIDLYVLSETGSSIYTGGKPRNYHEIVLT